MPDITAFMIRAYETQNPIEPKLRWVAHVWSSHHDFQKQGTARDLLPATAFGATQEEAILQLSTFLAEEMERQRSRESRYAKLSETMRTNNPRKTN